MLSENTINAVMNAKYVTDKVVDVSEYTNWLEECGIAQSNLLDMWFTLNDIIKNEASNNSVTYSDTTNVTVEHWTDIDVALQTARDFLYDDTVWEELVSNYPEQADKIADDIDSFGINY